MEMQPTEQEHEVIEVDVERMPEPQEQGSSPGRLTAERVKRGFGPVLAGIVIDVVDFSTFLPAAGLVLGSVAGFWLARRLGFQARHALLAAVGSGIYCMFPPTTLFPFATLLGAAAPFFINERKNADAS